MQSRASRSAVRDKESLVTLRKSEMCYLGGISPMEAEAAACRRETAPLGFQVLTLSVRTKKGTQQVVMVEEEEEEEEEEKKKR